ncbi:hypothetical protein KQI84_15025 [bacterium]|nr:hypothetical protein [bacterium]
MSSPHPPRDPKQLLVEMDARIKVRDIREWEKLKHQVSIKWWESGLLLLLFLSGLGILVTIAKLVPRDNGLLYAFILVWFGLFVLAVIACLEFLVLKFRALRRMQTEMNRHLLDQEKAMKAIRDYLEAREEFLSSSSEEEPEAESGQTT